MNRTLRSCLGSVWAEPVCSVTRLPRETVTTGGRLALGSLCLLSLWRAVTLSLTRTTKEFLIPVSDLRAQLLWMLSRICGIITSCKCGAIFECWFYGRFEALGTENVAVIEKWFHRSSWADEERCDSGLKKKKAIRSLCCLLCYLRWKREYKW